MLASKGYQLTLRRAQFRRQGAAAAEFAICLPFLLLVLFGLWEIGRITEVQNVSWNSAIPNIFSVPSIKIGAK